MAQSRSPLSGFHTVTLGCKLNQFDSAALEGELARRGLVRQDDPTRAQVVIVNTCTVTHRADSDARKRVRALRRGNPDCKLFVTGCYAEREPASITSILGVDRVFGNTEKPRFGEILEEEGVGREPDVAPGGPENTTTHGDRGCDAALDLPRAVHFGERSRAFLKVQDGCRLSCSYCIIPTVRGASRSVPMEELAQASRSLAAAGYREIVLTGVNTGDWGLDLTPRRKLRDLLQRLLEACGPVRFRLNSLEPRTIDPELVRLLGSEPRLASHLQVPLQSGSDRVLGLMRRNYRRAHYSAVMERLQKQVPDIGLGADVIVGFPGESDSDFAETCHYITDSPLSYLHVFSWSARPGTDACDYPDRIRPEVIRERSRVLRRLGDGLATAFRERFVGRELDAVVLGQGPAGSRALTGNFIETTLATGAAPARQLVRVRIDDATPAGARATIVGVPPWTARQAAGRTPNNRFTQLRP